MCHERDLRRGPDFLPKPFNGLAVTGEDGGSEGDELLLWLPCVLTLPRGVLVGRGKY